MGFSLLQEMCCKPAYVSDRSMHSDQTIVGHIGVAKLKSTTILMRDDLTLFIVLSGTHRI